MNNELILNLESLDESMNLLKNYNENEYINEIINKSKIDLNEKLEEEFLLKVYLDNEIY